MNPVRSKKSQTSAGSKMSRASNGMKILVLRTDKPEAELYIYDGHEKLGEIKWQAHLKLAETLNSKIEEILNKLSISYDGLDAIAIYKGPGSFTGLRIGMSVANALAYAQNIPIAAENGEDWIEKSIKALQSGKNDQIALPEYGAPAHITKPRK
jgi:tRNA threonylcarbamoyladenosine biosynthesis protein TsaB